MFDNPFKRKSDEEEKRKEGRLPPGQSLTNKFPVLHYGPVPPFNPLTWSFKVWGEVEQPVEWNWDRVQSIAPNKTEHGYPLCYPMEQIRHGLGRGLCPIAGGCGSDQTAAIRPVCDAAC